MKLAIIGGRDFDDYDLLRDTICAHFYPFSIGESFGIISGGAKGADKLGEMFADLYSKPKKIFPAEWNKYGKSAGFIRNQHIVDACDMVLAFWDGKSKGTQDTINKAKLAKKPTFIVYY